MKLIISCLVLLAVGSTSATSLSDTLDGSRSTVTQLLRNATRSIGNLLPASGLTGGPAGFIENFKAVLTNFSTNLPNNPLTSIGITPPSLDNITALNGLLQKVLCAVIDFILGIARARVLGDISQKQLGILTKALLSVIKLVVDILIKIGEILPVPGLGSFIKFFNDISSKVESTATGAPDAVPATLEGISYEFLKTLDSSEIKCTKSHQIMLLTTGQP